MSRLRLALNAAFMPRAALESHRPPSDLRLPNWYIAAFIVGLILVCPVGMSAQFYFPASTSYWIKAPMVFGVQIVGIAILLLGGRRRLRHFVRSAHESGAVLCTNCHYRIDDLPGADRCPECGIPCSIEEAAAAWEKLRRALKLPEAPSPARTPPPARTAPAAPSPGP